MIDPRTLRPLDLDTILESVRKTNRAVIVEEGWPHGGVGANLATLITEQAFDYLDAPVQRVTGADVPHALLEAARAGGDPARRARGQAALATAGREHSDGRHRHAPALRLDGGGDDPQVAEVGRRRGRGRRRAGRDRDRQGEHGLRGRRRRDADRDPRRGGRRRCRSARSIARVGDAGEAPAERTREGRGAVRGADAGATPEAQRPPEPPRQPAPPDPAASGTEAPPLDRGSRAPPSQPVRMAATAVKASPIAGGSPRSGGVDLGELAGSGPGWADRQGRRRAGG